MIKQFLPRLAAIRLSAHRWGPVQCAGFVLLVLIGCVALNIAGCGGGGGGGGAARVASVNVTIELRDDSGRLANGTVTLNGQTHTTVNFRAKFNVRPGRYTVRFTINGEPERTAAIVVSGVERNQVFIVSPAGGGNGIVSGRIFLQSGGTCGPLGVSAKVLIRLRKLSPPEGNPIVASAVKPDQSGRPESERGRYNITIPFPGTFRVDVRQAPAEGSESTAPFCGQSASFRVANDQNDVTNINICASPNLCSVVGTPPPPPITPTPGPTTTPTATTGPTATAGPTVTPTATVGGRPTTPGGALQF